MANGSVVGAVRDENGAPLQGLVAWVRRKSNFSELGSELGSGTSSGTGAFLVNYGAIDDPFLQLEIELTDLLGRRVGTKRLFTTVTAPTLDTGIWTVPQADAGGWVATGGAFAPTAGNEIDLLIDNEVAWAAVTAAVTTATSINFMLFYLDVGNTFMTFVAGAGGSAPTIGERLENALRAAGLRNGPNVSVRLLLNQMAPFYPLTTAFVVGRHFNGAVGVETRRFSIPLLAPVHAKVLIIRNNNGVEAYVIGSPFVQDYYDGVDHKLHDERHGEKLCSKGIKVPTHDVSLRVRGPAVAHLEETFLLHWNRVKPSGTPDLDEEPAPAPLTGGQAVTAQVTRSLWGAGFFTARPQGEASIYEAYLRAIANAETYVYLENQYFTCRELAKALTRAVKDKPDLQIILLTNNKVDIPGYSSWHPANITRLLTGLTAAERTRVGVFTLWTHEDRTGSPDRVGRTYVHSKVAIVDDKWATVGSANLDGVSLLLSEHADILGREEVRATEANIVVLGAGAGGTQTDLPARLRKQLWAEHLGFLTAAGAPDAAATALQSAPTPGGWLGLWNARVTAKLGSLTSTPVTRHPARILPWPHKDGVTLGGFFGISSAGNYLEACDIVPTGSPPSFEIADTFDFYDFEQAAWE